MSKISAASNHELGAGAAGLEGESCFRAIADCTYDWESWHGADGRLIWVNRAVERATGYSVAECLALRNYPLPLVVAEDRPRMAELLAGAARGSSGNDVEFRIQPRRGPPQWGAVSWQPMSDASGEALGFRTSVRDIGERKRAEQVLRESEERYRNLLQSARRMEEQIRRHAEELERVVAERTDRVRQLEQRRTQVEKLAALSQLAAGVAHEVNNPLAGIRNAFELIKEGLSPDHPYYHYLELIDAEIARIAGILHQLHRVYRPKPRVPSDFDLRKAVDEVSLLLQVAANKRAIRVELGGADSLPPARLAEGEVKQILYNLLQNAIQASPEGARVDVRVSWQRGEFRVSVEDQGSGIEPEVLPQIFDPFFTTKSAGVEGGMGLGLSVSRSLAEALGGRIEVESAPGRGSRFTLVLPCPRQSPQRAT